VFKQFQGQQHAGRDGWTAGSARTLRDFLWLLLTTKKLGWLGKLSSIRQNAYFTTTLLTGLAILLGTTTVLWLIMAWNTYAVEYYLYLLGICKLPYIFLLYWCILSNFVEPLVMIVVKKRSCRDLLHLPMMVWYAWSVIPT
jgi:hypothetical protein